VLVYGVRDKWSLAEEIKRRVPEAERVYVVLECSRAALSEIVEAVKRVCREHISQSDTFAVRTTRRGRHDFTSIDVNVAVGSAVREATGGKRVNIMIGAREGGPTSLFRFANYVVDVAPGVVISADYALASALTALSTVLHERLVAEKAELSE
jgi:hypothetical protein